MFIALHYYIIKQTLKERLKGKRYYNRLSINTSSAFTLAEILITLTIIGVVASLTIPSLVNNIGDQQNKIAWKKTFATLSQVTQKIVMEEGGSLKGSFTDGGVLKNRFMSQLNYVKSCDINQSLGNCWHKNDGSVKVQSGALADSWSGAPSAVLSDGTLLWFWIYASDCSQLAGTFKRCGTIYIDVNGFNTPNVIGKDIQMVHLLENKILPAGAGDGNENTCKPTATTWSPSCAAEYLYQ